MNKKGVDLSEKIHIIKERFLSFYEKLNPPGCGINYVERRFISAWNATLVCFKEAAAVYGESDMIAKNDTFCDLIDSLRHAPKTTAREMIDTLSPEKIKEIIDNTINGDQPMDNIYIGLRALRTKGLLENLETKINPTDYLKLVEKKGTFFELIHILHFSSQTMVKSLMGNISADLTGRLIDKAVAKKLLFNSFHRELKLLKRLCGGFDLVFEQKIGVGNILKLIFNNGNLGILVELVNSFTVQEISQLKLIEMFRLIPGNKKDEFILRGDFYKFCAALVHCRQLYLVPKNIKEISPGEVAIIQTLIAKSTLKSMNRGISAVNYFPHKGYKVLLSRLVGDFVEKIKIEDILPLSASEQIAYLSILSQLEKSAKSRITEITGNLNEPEFIKEKNFISSLQLLQHVLVVNDVDLQLRKDILKLSNSLKIKDKLSQETSLNVFLFVWNTYSLYTEISENNFSEWLDPDIVNSIYRVIERHKRIKINIEGTRHFLMLIGLLDYLEIAPGRTRRLFPRGFKLLNLSRTFLAQVLEKSPFIPGFFYLKGIDFFAKKPLFPNKWKILAHRVFDLNLKGKGVRKLVDAFQHKINRQVVPLQ